MSLSPLRIGLKAGPSAAPQPLPRRRAQRLGARHAVPGPRSQPKHLGWRVIAQQRFGDRLTVIREREPVHEGVDLVAHPKQAGVRAVPGLDRLGTRRVSRRRQGPVEPRAVLCVGVVGLARDEQRILFVQQRHLAVRVVAKADLDDTGRPSPEPAGGG